MRLISDALTLANLGLRLWERLKDVWKFWQRIRRGRTFDIEGAEKKHRAGRETLITAEIGRGPPRHNQLPQLPKLPW